MRHGTQMSHRQDLYAFTYARWFTLRRNITLIKHVSAVKKKTPQKPCPLSLTYIHLRTLMTLTIAVFHKLDLKESNPRATETELTFSQSQDLTKGLFISRSR